MHGDDLPDGLDLLVLDCAVNQGPVTVIRLLQEGLGIKQDGIPDPLTLTSAARAMPDLLGEFQVLRAWRYEIDRLFRLYDTARSWRP